MPLDNVAELTAEQVQAILVQPLEQASVFLASGPVIFDGTGPIRVPKLTEGVEPEWLGPGEQITGDDPDFDEVVLLPSTMKSLKTLTRYSNELARSSVIALDAVLRARLVRDVATKLDAALIAGDGGTPAGTEPLGLTGYTGVQDMAAVGPIELDDLQDAVGLALGANVNVPAMRWFMRSNIFVGLRKIKDGDDRYMIQPDPSQAGGFTLLGLPVTVTNRLPEATGKSDVILADFSTIAVARDLAPSVKLLDQTFGDYDQQAIRVVARYDAGPMLPEAIVVLRDVEVPTP